MAPTCHVIELLSIVLSIFIHKKNERRRKKLRLITLHRKYVVPAVSVISCTFIIYLDVLLLHGGWRIKIIGHNKVFSASYRVLAIHHHRRLATAK